MARNQRDALVTTKDGVGLPVVGNEMTGTTTFPERPTPSAHYLSTGNAVISGLDCQDVASAHSVVLVEAGEEVRFDVDETTPDVTFVAVQ